MKGKEESGKAKEGKTLKGRKTCPDWAPPRNEFLFTALYVCRADGDTLHYANIKTGVSYSRQFW